MVLLVQNMNATAFLVQHLPKGRMARLPCDHQDAGLAMDSLKATATHWTAAAPNCRVAHKSLLCGTTKQGPMTALEQPMKNGMPALSQHRKEFICLIRFEVVSSMMDSGLQFFFGRVR